MCMLRAAGLLYSLLHTLHAWLVFAVLGGNISCLTLVLMLVMLLAMLRSRGSLCSVAGDQGAPLLLGELEPELELVGEGEDL